MRTRAHDRWPNSDPQACSGVLIEYAPGHDIPNTPARDELKSPGDLGIPPCILRGLIPSAVLHAMF